VMGIEPTLEAWEAAVLPLNYTRSTSQARRIIAGATHQPTAKLCTMDINLNGKPQELPDGSTVGDLLRQLGLADKRVAVEINGDIVPRSLHSTHGLTQDDRVEVVVAVGGG
jgi:sulfur carrier protein